MLAGGRCECVYVWNAHRPGIIGQRPTYASSDSTDRELGRYGRQTRKLGHALDVGGRGLGVLDPGEPGSLDGGLGEFDELLRSLATSACRATTRCRNSTMVAMSSALETSSSGPILVIIGHQSVPERRNSGQNGVDGYPESNPS